MLDALHISSLLLMYPCMYMQNFHKEIKKKKQARDEVRHPLKREGWNHRLNLRSVRGGAETLS